MTAPLHWARQAAYELAVKSTQAEVTRDVTRTRAPYDQRDQLPVSPARLVVLQDSQRPPISVLPRQGSTAPTVSGHHCHSLAYR